MSAGRAPAHGPRQQLSGREDRRRRPGETYFREGDLGALARGQRFASGWPTASTEALRTVMRLTRGSAVPGRLRERSPGGRSPVAAEDEPLISPSRLARQRPPRRRAPRRPRDPEAGPRTIPALEDDPQARQRWSAGRSARWSAASNAGRRCSTSRVRRTQSRRVVLGAGDRPPVRRLLSAMIVIKPL